ncbi:hypothetical protein [Salibacterium sp. K-3]
MSRNMFNRRKGNGIYLPVQPPIFRYGRQLSGAGSFFLHRMP